MVNMDFLRQKSVFKSVYSFWLFIASVDISLINDCDSTSSVEIDRHLQMGVQMIAKGQLNDALSHFHAAIDGDPTNYMSYYRRATVYLALGRSRTGLQDLDDVVRLKPDFTAARSQRASILTKLGRLDEAYIDVEKVLQKDPENEEANRLFVSYEPLKQKILMARENLNSHHFEEALHLLKEIIEDCPWDASVREWRIEAYQAIGDIMSAIADLRVVTKLTQDNTIGFFRLSSLYYKNGDVDQALTEIRECLKLDPEHKQCFPLYKKVKKIAKLASNSQEAQNEKDFGTCVNSAKKILKEEQHEMEIQFIAYDKMCQCEGLAGNPSAAIESCNKAIEIKEEPRSYCDRAEAHILNENFEGASSDFQQALNIDENFNRAKEGLKKAQKLLKQASKRDYYKILGVKRNASKKEISKAYRTLAQKWHPDHFDGEEKKKAEKMFIDIASAKEVLTDEEKRAKFDQGEDPLDPEQQQHGHGFNPFQHFAFRHPGGGHPGGGGGFPGGDGGPFKFKFQFN